MKRKLDKTLFLSQREIILVNLILVLGILNPEGRYCNMYWNKTTSWHTFKLGCGMVAWWVGPNMKKGKWSNHGGSPEAHKTQARGFGLGGSWCYTNSRTVGTAWIWLQHQGFRNKIIDYLLEYLTGCYLGGPTQSWEAWAIH